MNQLEQNNIKEVLLLEAINKKSSASQRQLSLNLGLSLGLVNEIIKSLVNKGDLEISRNSGKQVNYLITRQGYARFVRHSNARIAQSFQHICDVKRQLGRLLDGLVERGVTEFIMDGENTVIASLVGEVFREIVGNQGKLLWGKEVSGANQVLLKLNATDKANDQNVVHILHELVQE